MQKCTSIHNPPKSYGDCMRACVASLIKRDDVPHCFDGRGGEQAWADLRVWLRHNGYFLLAFQSDENVWEFMEINNRDVSYILLCKTSGGDHAVLCKGGSIIHDPAIVERPIIGPSANGWIVCVIGKLDS